jgi:16S rRNA (uracil1498-N3)-methyltransferase
MYHFFVEENQISADEIIIRGQDVNHIRNVLRLKAGEQVIITKNDDAECDYYCAIRDMDEESVRLHIDWTEKGRELAAKIYLFQGLPKADKMELIIQKAVELGAYEIIPVAMKRSVVKLDEKKSDSKIKRWQAISESAAKQSKRSMIPQITSVMSFADALSYAKEIDIKLMPYENAKGMEETRRILNTVQPKKSVAVFIGPEGGYEETEVQQAMGAGFLPVTLGKRILRTETAGFAMLSALMMQLEE